MQRSFQIIRRFLPVSVIALSLGACASTGSPQPTPQVTVDSMLRVADLTRSGGDYVNAVGLYQRAHELAPDDERPLVALGQVFAQLGSPASAAEAYRAAIAVEPSDVEARRGLGVALIAAGQPEAAIVELERAIDLAKDYRIYNSLGVAYDMIGDHASAQTYYNTGLGLAPGNLELSNNLGLSLALEGRYPEAIALLEKIASEPSAPSRYRQNLALALGLAGERDRARQVAQTDLDQTTAEKNLSYFDVLKGLDDHRTMAAALGVHILGQASPVAPAGAFVPPAMQNSGSLPQVETPASVPAGIEAQPLPPASSLESGPAEADTPAPESATATPPQPTAVTEIEPVGAESPVEPSVATPLRPLPVPVARAAVEPEPTPRAAIDPKPSPAAHADAKPLDDFERETGGADEDRPSSPARFEELEPVQSPAVEPAVVRPAEEELEELDPAQSRAVEHGARLSALVKPAEDETVLVAREDEAPSCGDAGARLPFATAGGAAMADAAFAMMGYLAVGPSYQEFTGSGLIAISGFAASRFAR